MSLGIKICYPGMYIQALEEALKACLRPNQSRKIAFSKSSGRGPWRLAFGQTNLEKMSFSKALEEALKACLRPNQFEKMSFFKSSGRGPEGLPSAKPIWEKILFLKALEEALKACLRPNQSGVLRPSLYSDFCFAVSEYRYSGINFRNRFLNLVMLELIQKHLSTQGYIYIYIRPWGRI